MPVCWRLWTTSTPISFGSCTRCDGAIRQGYLRAARLPKKSKRGIATLIAEVDLIEQRLKRAKRGLRAMGKEQETDIPVTESSGNVFADMGLPGAEEEVTKAHLASHIRQVIKRQLLIQVAAAAVMGIDQPKVSALLNGRLANFSSERLMRFLTALGQDVDITVRAKPRDRAHGRIRVLGEVHP
jgi:predicted XRE-type DNA-binding protein